jgi:hypothetical protein
VDPANPNAIVASVKDVGIFVSADGGATWPGGPYNAGLTNGNPAIVALAFAPDGGGLYAADFYSGVYRSTDGGQNWAGVPDAPMTGLSMRAVKDLALAGPVLYAATQGGGVLRFGGPSIVPTPSAHDFGSVALVSRSTLAVTIYNTGADARTLTSRTLVGTNASDFIVENDTCAGTLAASATCSVDVVFSPTLVGSRVATLELGSDDPFGATYAVSLRGTGVMVASTDGGAGSGGAGSGGAAGGAPSPGPSPGGGGSGAASGSPSPTPARDKGCGCALGAESHAARLWPSLPLVVALVARRRKRARG